MSVIFSRQNLIEQILNEVSIVAGLFWERGWSEKNAGNISILLPDRVEDSQLINSEKYDFEKPFPGLSGKCFYVTGTGSRMQDISRSPLEYGLIVQISESGDGYILIKQNESLKPTSELPAHLGIHDMIAERESDERVVLHTHATEVIALTQYDGINSAEDLNRILWGMHPETMVFIPEGVGFVSYMLPGTQKIADATTGNFKNHQIVIWEKHGIFAIGKELISTFDNIDIVCKSAKIWFQCKSAGFEPEGLAEQELDELRELVKKFK